MQVALQQFTGPLDALLQLVEEHKMPITELSVSAVTEQYLQYLDTLEETDPNELADFLVVAAKLLLLKSKALLPQFAPEEDEGPNLVDQLRLYKMFVAASRELEARWLSAQRSYGRVEPVRTVVDPTPPANVTERTLHVSMLRLVQRLKPPKPLPRTTIDRAVSLKEKIAHLRQLLSEKGSVNFFGTVADKASRTDVIVGFLALLELVKQQAAVVDQDKLFGDIVIKRI